MEKTKLAGSTVKNVFNEFLDADKENQKEFDRRMTKAMDTVLETAKNEWQEKFKNLDGHNKKQEKEIDKLKNENNFLKLKFEAINLARTKNMDLDLLNLLEFSNMSKEQLENKIDWIVNIFNRTLEKRLNIKQSSTLKLSEEISEALNKANLSDNDISNYVISVGNKKYKVESVGINWVDVN